MFQIVDDVLDGDGYAQRLGVDAARRLGAGRRRRARRRARRDPGGHVRPARRSSRASSSAPPSRALAATGRVGHEAAAERLSLPISTRSFAGRAGTWLVLEASRCLADGISPRGERARSTSLRPPHVEECGGVAAPGSATSAIALQATARVRAGRAAARRCAPRRARPRRGRRRTGEHRRRRRHASRATRGRDVRARWLQRSPRRAREPRRPVRREHVGARRARPRTTAAPSPQPSSSTRRPARSSVAT